MFHYESFILMRTTWIFNQGPDVFVMWLLFWSKKESRIGSLTPSQKSGYTVPTGHKHAPPIANRSSQNVVLKLSHQSFHNIVPKLSQSCPRLYQSCLQAVQKLSQSPLKVVSKLSSSCLKVIPMLSQSFFHNWLNIAHIVQKLCQSVIGIGEWQGWYGIVCLYIFFLAALAALY